MTIQVEFFSRLKDLTGISKMTQDLPDDTRVSDLLATLYREFPELEKWDAHLRVAIGVEWVARDQSLCDGDAVSIMPPVSGG